jgi:hypothetical protein
MFRTDTGNFNRFLTSLGLLMLLGALVIPYFYFGDTDTLRVPAHELNKLTPVAREALETRQRRNRDLEIWILGFAAALALGGIGSLWFGGKRLRRAQKKEDAAVDRKARRDDVEIQQMSQSEVAEKREEQARESAQEDERGRPEGAARPAETQPRRPAAAPGSSQTLRDSRASIERIENAVRATLENSDFASYKFYYEVKTVSGGQQLRMDGLFRPENPEMKDVVFELKVVRQTRMIQARIRNFADMLLALISRYHQMAPVEAVGWLVIVVPDGVEPMTLGERRRLEDQATDSLAGMGKVTVAHESEIRNLAASFRQLFESQAK